MRGRRIYVDIDDVLSSTIERLIDLLEQLHDRRVEVEEVLHFDLEKSFGLDADEIARFMEHAHADPVIESLEPAPGAREVLGRWAASGHHVHLVTGRPPITNAASRRWLASHRLHHDALDHLDKWGRPSWNLDGLPAIGFDELPRLRFEYAVEDSLDTAVRLVEQLDVPVALMDRPWNRAVDRLPREVRERLVRCRGWDDVAGWLARNEERRGR
ncbi:MAG: hypothetical protein H6748_22070 [Spirochaetaceae bacterium]|nr:hypothetical protein [Myxococcales bacterium]MCB9726749.1 hypothetical protein [Spirochaetaceae bacterium]HPG24043.1 hypothetical protein [Myxococcota bacterium]